MIQHFEDLWNEAETLSDGMDVEESFNNIQQYALDLRVKRDNKNLEITLGKMLFAICHITKVFPINSYAALAEQVQSRQIDILE